MSLGVDDYLAWAPADMVGGAGWLEERSGLMDQSARAIRDAADRGTEGQSGQFVATLRDDAAEAAARVHELADLLLEASTIVRQAGAALGSGVARLRQVENELTADGFTRVDGEHVRDTRTDYADAAERKGRENRAKEFRERVWDLLDEIQGIDDQANRALHGAVGRDVRDRTDVGNGVPEAAIPAGGADVATVSALMATAADQAEKGWSEAVQESWRGSSRESLIMARGLGPVAAALGFIGAVAARPEGEPLHEAIVAEGVGVVGGAVGGPVGVAFAFPAVGPLTGPGAYFKGSLLGSMLASAAVREAFDRAN